MSFTLKIKREICKKSPKDRQTAVAELVGIICFGANIKGDCLNVKIENAFVAKRIFSLVKECFGITPIIKASENKKKNMYFVEIATGDEALDILAQLGMVKNSHEMKDFVSFNINDNDVKLSIEYIEKSKEIGKKIVNKEDLLKIYSIRELEKQIDDTVDFICKIINKNIKSLKILEN